MSVAERLSDQKLEDIRMSARVLRANREAGAFKGMNTLAEEHRELLLAHIDAMNDEMHQAAE